MESYLEKKIMTSDSLKQRGMQKQRQILFHLFNRRYAFSIYATGDNPYGPFTYQGVLLNPVEGWTNHHSIIEFNGKWYLFYHDAQLSGKTHLRNVKVTELKFNEDGSIQTLTAQK